MFLLTFAGPPSIYSQALHMYSRTAEGNWMFLNWVKEQELTRFAEETGSTLDTRVL